MRNVIITTMNEVPNYMNNVIGIVSLIDNDAELPWKGDVKVPHLIRKFLDVEHIPLFGTAPSIKDFDAVLEFMNTLPANGIVLVHCHMGASRSPAMALGILVSEGLTPEEACDYLDDIRPMTDPNRRIVKIIDKTLKLNHELIDLVEKRYAKVEGLILPKNI